MTYIEYIFAHLWHVKQFEWLIALWMLMLHLIA